MFLAFGSQVLELFQKFGGETVLVACCSEKLVWECVHAFWSFKEDANIELWTVGNLAGYQELS